MHGNRQGTDGPHRDAGAGGPPSLAPRLKLRTRIVLPMIALAIVPTLGLGLFIIRQTQASLWQAATERVRFDTAAKTRAIRAFLDDVQQDLLFLSQLNGIRVLAESQAGGRTDRVAILRQEAERELMIFSSGKRAYYQVRYLDTEGMEVVRLNVEAGQPRIVPAHELQDKRDRYYVTESLALGPGEIYTSPMDLNVEQGRVEDPGRAVVRYGTGVFDPTGTRLGILIVNLDAEYIFSLLGPLPPQTEAWLTDETGRYLGYSGPSAVKRARDAVGRNRTIEEDYTPEQVQTIAEVAETIRVLETADVLLSIGRIPVAGDASSPHWTLLIANSRVPLASPIRQFTILLSIAVVLAAALAAIFAVSAANYLAEPVARLRHTIQEITAGNLSERVAIRTGDEIEGLANDFNTMMERLRDTQTSNVALEREVARQATHLAELQTGLARADKLTSIGQMTAGVMHEIGNPLAAIKTKIQVAEEEHAICPRCEPLTSEVLHEVNRLAAFLRSFSRLAKMPVPRFDSVPLGDIVDGVRALVSPELQRRGLRLERVDLDAVPDVRADSDQLRQVLINLILNAAEASPAGGAIRVSLDRRPDGWPRVRVQDHGTGISPADLPRIWDPFFTTKADGNGLGLSVCRQIVDDHGGTIEIDRAEPVGTVATVVLPPAATAARPSPDPLPGGHA